MDLVSLTTVKALDSFANDGKDDPRLKLMISSLSSTVQRKLEMNRFVEYKRRTETLHVARDQKVFRVRSYPIGRLLAVVNDGVSLDLNAVKYDEKGFLRIGAYFTANLPVTAEVQAGSILQSPGLRYGPGMLLVTVEGEMARDTEDFEAAFPDLAYEIAKQVVFEFRRMKTITEKSVASGGETTTHETLDLRKQLKDAIAACHKGVGLA